MGMNFADFLNQESQRIENESSGNSSERIMPKNGYPVTVDAGTTQYFRLLPSIYPDSLYQFIYELRSIYIPITKNDGTSTSVPVVLAPLEKDKSHNYTRQLTPFEQEIDQWGAEGKLPGPFGQQRPRKIYYVNAVQVFENNGVPYQETGADGKPVIRVLQLTTTAYSSLLSILSNNMTNPIPISQEYPTSFISDKETVAIAITAPVKNAKDKSYKVNVTQARVPAMYQGWNAVDSEGHPLYAEDLRLLSTPTEVSQPDTVSFLEQKLNGGTQQGTSNQPQFNPYAPVSPQQAPIGPDPFNAGGRMPWDNPNVGVSPVQQAPAQQQYSNPAFPLGNPAAAPFTGTNPSLPLTTQAPVPDPFNVPSQPSQFSTFQNPAGLGAQIGTQVGGDNPRQLSVPQQAPQAVNPAQVSPVVPNQTFVPSQAQQVRADQATAQGNQNAQYMMENMRNQLEDILKPKQ